MARLPKSDDSAQSKRFIELAEELGATGKPEDLKLAVRTLALQKRASDPETKKG
jgi:hypothetical protein